MTSVLFVVSAADHWTLADGTRHPTGYWAEELAVPHRVFTKAGWEVTIATPGGIAPTVDSLSLGIAAVPGAPASASRPIWSGSTASSPPRSPSTRPTPTTTTSSSTPAATAPWKTSRKTPPRAHC